MAILRDKIEAHAAAMAEYDALSDDQWGDATIREPLANTLDDTRAALIDHAPANLEEVAAKAAFMANCRSFVEWVDLERTELIRALTPDRRVTEHLDAVLIQLGAELKQAWARWDRTVFCSGHVDGPPDDDPAYVAAREECSRIARKILDATAHTVAGLRVKAYAISWCQVDECVDFGEDGTDLQLAAQIVNSLLRMPEIGASAGQSMMQLVGGHIDGAPGIQGISAALETGASERAVMSEEKS